MTTHPIALLARVANSPREPGPPPQHRSSVPSVWPTDGRTDSPMSPACSAQPCDADFAIDVVPDAADLWPDGSGLYDQVDGEAHARLPESFEDDETTAPRFPASPRGPVPRSFAAAASAVADQTQPTIAVFDPQEARERLREMNVGEDGGDDIVANGPRGVDSLGSEEARRAKLLLRLAGDPSDGRRAALIGDAAGIDAVRALAGDAANFAPALTAIADALALSRLAQRPAAIGPILLLGPPGIGKTYVAKRLAAAIGAPYRLLAMNLAPAFGQIGGLDVVWRSAKAGNVAMALIETSSASPLLMFDEIDKPMAANPRNTPYDALHSLFEPENAAQFRDEYLDMRFDARHLISIATANHADAMPVSLLDRLLVIDVQPPSREQRRLIAQRLYAERLEAAGGVLAPELDADVLDGLSVLTPRRMTRAIALAIARAAGRGRDRVGVDDVRAAAAMLAGGEAQEAMPIGFIPPRV